MKKSQFSLQSMHVAIFAFIVLVYLVKQGHTVSQLESQAGRDAGRISAMEVYFSRLNDLTDMIDGQQDRLDHYAEMIARINKRAGIVEPISMGHVPGKQPEAGK